MAQVTTMDKPKQQKVFRELLKIDEKAAQAYKGALRVLEDFENPDRLSQSAHSLREVTVLISRKVSIPQEITGNGESLKKKIERQFAEESNLLPTPAEKETRALIKRWGELHGFFLGIVHHGKEVSEEEFLTKLSEFEAILLQFMKPIPVTLQELDSLLSIQTPTLGEIKRLSELLKHPTHVDYFFSRLIWPAWLMPLKEHGFFSKPPATIREGNYVMFPMWPLSKYLIKISAQRPREVINTIKDIQETNNFRVHIDLVECALKMPSPIAKEILSLAKKWLPTPYPTLISEKLGDLCTKLSQENETGSALKLLEDLLDIEKEDGESEFLLKGARPHFDLWNYEQILKNVVPVVLQKDPCKVIEILCNKLLKAIGLERSDERAPYDDLSYIWRPAIENHPQNMDERDVKNLLVATIRESLEKIGKSDEEICKKCYRLLSEYDLSVFRRIELNLMRLFPEMLKSEIQNALSQKQAFDDINLWYEYYHLLQEQFSRLPENIKQNVLEWIDEGPDLARFEIWYKQERKVSPPAQEKDAYKAHWQMRHLSPIKEGVSSLWREKWNELVTKYGEPEHPDFHVYMGPIVVGTTSPLTKEEIEKKSPQEVVNYLKTWIPSKDPFGPSREALGDVIGEIVSEDPSNYIEVCQEFRTLLPVYIYHLIEGFREAVKKENAFDWSPIIALCKDILVATKQAKISVDEVNLYDWKSVKRGIADLLEEGLKSKTISPPFKLRKTIWQLTKILLQDDEPTLSFESKYGGENMDPVTLSLNTVRGKAMHVLFCYARWCARCLGLSKSEDRMVPEVKEQLEKMLNPEYEPTSTIRAVYGLYLPNLFYLNGNWTEEYIPTIFPKDTQYRTLSRVAWEAYVTYCGFYNDVYRKMRDQYNVAINKLTSPEISKTAKMKLSEHLMKAYLWKLEELGKDSLIDAFFKKAPPEVRGHAIWFIGRVLEHIQKGEIDKTKDSIVEQSMNLWKWRIEEAKKIGDRARKESVQELKWFGIWFIKGPFERKWMISQLYKSLQLTEGTIELADDVIKSLTNYAEEHYLDVLRALILLVKGNRKGWLLMSSKEKIEKIMEFIVAQHPPQEIKDNLNELVDSLARSGYHEFTRFFVR